MSKIKLSILLTVLALAAGPGFSQELPPPELILEAQNPGPLFRPVPLWWWDGDRLQIERLRWQLDQVHAKGVDQVCLIYLSPLRSRPPYFTEDWWELYQEVVEHAASLGMKIWLTDGVAWGSPFINNSVLEEDPGFRGRILQRQEKTARGPALIRHEIPKGYEIAEILGAFAYPVTGDGLDLAGAIDLSGNMEGRRLEWQAPTGTWKIMIFYAQPMGFQGNQRQGNGRGYGIDFANPEAMQSLIRLTTGEYERRVGPHIGKTVVGTFQDELVTHHHYGFPPYSERFSAEFLHRKEYDLVPLLGALYHDAGDPTDKIRCDFFDVMVQLFEEAFYKPYFEWHETRNMLIAHDQFGRRDLIAQTWGYGDYFRTQRWFQVPGYDDWNQAVPGRNWKDAKLASSIAQLYDRPRVWVEALHSSGWGLDLQEQVAAVNENYIYGANLFDMHGLDYATYGSWYSWASPSAHFRMPYWMHYREFADYVARLSFVQSQGDHVADVGIFYPVHTIQANLRADGGATDMAGLTESYFWSAGRHLLDEQIDFHFVDDESLQRGVINDGSLEVSNVRFSTLILPPLTTIDRQTLSRLGEFVRKGGLLISLARLPGASVQAGRGDQEVAKDLESIFGDSHPGERLLKRHSLGGMAVFLPEGVRELGAIIKENRTLDFETGAETLMVQHRRTEEMDLYMLYNRSAEAVGARIKLRSTGSPHRFDPATGAHQPIYEYDRQGLFTGVTLAFEPYQACVIYFDRRLETPSLDRIGVDNVTGVVATEAGLEISGWHRSSARIEVQDGRETYSQTVAVTPSIQLDDRWELELKPTLDNQWGDFRLPPSLEPLGAEVREFHYRMESPGQEGISLGWHGTDFDDSGWEKTTYSVGPYWWALGPVPNRGAEAVTIQDYGPELDPDPAARYTILGAEYGWRSQSFSLDFGLEKDPDYWNRLGPKGSVDPTFLEPGSTDHYGLVYLFTHVYSPNSTHALLLSPTSGYWESHRIWVNGEVVSDIYHRDQSGKFGSLIGVDLNEGWNTLLIKTNQRHRSVRLYVYLVDQAEILAPAEKKNPSAAPHLRRFADSKFIFDPYGDDEKRTGWYRFPLPPGTRSLKMQVEGKATVFVNGAEQAYDESTGSVHLAAPLAEQGLAVVRVVHQRGRYAGAAFTGPVFIAVDRGTVQLGDWSEQGLQSYSGAAVYRQSFQLPAGLEDKKLVLDLGEVRASASVRINGQEVGSRGWTPYRFDITEQVRPGANNLEITVANTLANHYLIGTADSHVYEGQTRSGLLGPVRILPYTRVKLVVPQ